MFNKTSSFFFQDYGFTYTTLPEEAKTDIHEDLEIDNKTVNHLFYSNDDLYLQVLDGIVMIVVSKENESESFEQFVVHHTIKLKKKIYFNFFSITDSSRLRIIKPENDSITTFKLNGKAIECERIKSHVNVQEILAYYYQVKNTNYVFEGETHNHWELTFIDSGQLSTTIDNKEYTLNEYDLIVYAPGQFHTQKTGADNACSYLTVMFDMDPIDPKLLANRVFHASRDINKTIQDFVAITEDPHVYSSDFCICYLNEIILKLLHYQEQMAIPVANTPMQQKFENEFLNEIMIYINDNIYTPLTIEQLCRKFSISRSSLQQLFKKNLKVAPKQYISNLKLKKAKILIKESKYTISEISDKLGFTSIHYFSRKFKQEFALAPSDYAKTLYR